MEILKDPTLVSIDILTCDDEPTALNIMVHILPQLVVGEAHTTKSPRIVVQFLKELVEKTSRYLYSRLDDAVDVGFRGYQERARHRARRELVMLTEKAAPNAAKETASHGGDAYIAEPFSAEAVQRKIEALVRRSWAQV
ncbi:MAG: hypothetical protein P8M79_05735 [Alphaproteobacteria bacterium]|nr:hypothetical protein [Alphaproteobacteria bacterium]